MSVSDGRCYRKVTDVTFGRRKREDTMEWRDTGRNQEVSTFNGEWM